MKHLVGEGMVLETQPSGDRCGLPSSPPPPTVRWGSLPPRTVQSWVRILGSNPGLAWPWTSSSPSPGLSFLLRNGILGLLHRKPRCAQSLVFRRCSHEAQGEDSHGLPHPRPSLPSPPRFIFPRLPRARFLFSLIISRKFNCCFIHP